MVAEAEPTRASEKEKKPSAFSLQESQISTRQKKNSLHMRTPVDALEPITAPRASLPPFLLNDSQCLLLGGVSHTLASRMGVLLVFSADGITADRASGSLVADGMVLRCDESRAAGAGAVAAVCRADTLEFPSFLVERCCKLGVDRCLELFPFEDGAAALREAEACVCQLHADHAFEAADAVPHAARRFPGVARCHFSMAGDAGSEGRRSHGGVGEAVVLVWCGVVYGCVFDGLI
jgi:hypothetical protein